MIKLLLKRLLWPPHIYKALTASKKKKKSKIKYDPQLALYDKILGTGFLHYGYFDDPDIPPDEISVKDIKEAQLNYAKIIIDKIINKKGPALDAGCGMGGLIKILKEQKTPCVGLTPDKKQISYLTDKYPDITFINEKFENLPTKDYEQYFDTIIHSESLQYIDLKKAIENVLQCLQPSGRWIVIDYFRMARSHEKSGHKWDDFKKLLKEYNLEIVYQKDITPNIRPTLSYLYMWGNEIGRPVVEYVKEKFEKKHPGKYYLLEEIIEKLEYKLDKNLKIIDPEVFSEDKKYFLLCIEPDKNK